MSNEQPRVVKLNEILNDEQLADVQSLIERIQAGEVKLDTLRYYLSTQEASLREKEVDASYLFYAVCYSCRLF